MEIPEAVMTYARELWRQGGSVEASPPLAIAHAILAERERCAKIAETAFERGAPEAAGLVIASAIRATPEPL